MPDVAEIGRNLAHVRRRIGAAARRAGRDPASITLVAVSKTFPPESIRAAVAAGQHVFGENRVQESAQKIETLADLDLEWHLIGHLQSNKARKAVTAFRWIESVDSLPLLARLDAAAEGAAIPPVILIQVDLAHEATKHGAAEDAVRPLVDAAANARHLDLRGLMLVPPYPDTAEASRPWFQRLRVLRDRLVTAGRPADRLAVLSMGMSHDFEVAVAEGATLVRVGTAVFGTRAPVTPEAGERAAR
jgi:pyridoxal phosphate enzyme (YggS family)